MTAPTPMRPEYAHDPEPPAAEPFIDLRRVRLGSSYARWDYAKRLLWRWVNATVFRLPTPPKWYWQSRLLRWFGGDCRGQVKPSARVWHPWLLVLDDATTLGEHTTVYNLAPVRVGRHTVISQHVYLCSGTHDYLTHDFELVRDERARITIG
ncbi:MAG: hypothetical protein AAGA63_02000, partial [Pseudomonadota bacterium]